MASNLQFVCLLLLLFFGIKTTCSTTDYYTYNGQGNNELNTQWGASATYYLRTQMEAGYDDDAGSMNYVSSLPSPRLVSTTLTLPSHKSRERSSRQYTDMLTFFGQLLKHDMVMTQTAQVEEEAIVVPFCDFYHDKESCGLDEAALAATSPQTMSFTRSAFELDTDGKRQQLNLATAFIDGGGIYGYDSVTASRLRTYSKGKLSTYNDELPLNTLGMSLMDPVGKESTFNLRLAGDSRANSHPIALALHSLFVREHNRLAEEFHTKRSNLDDEELYQKARKWVIASLQNICFYEFLPTWGIELPPYTAYKSTVNPGIDAFFSTVAFRFGHSTIYDVVFRIDDEGMEIPAGHLLLHQSFYHPTLAFSAGIEPLLRGASLTRQAEITPMFSHGLKNFLYGSPKHGGQDLLALNIQRGRDHGIPLYNSARIQLNLDPKTSFSQVTSDYFLSKDLESVYGTVDNMDAYVGGLAEDPYMNTSFGELFYTSIQEQFTRLRDGDRFYFEHLGNGLFTEEEIAIIKNTTLRDIILRNTDIQVLPENIFIRNSSSPWPIIIKETPALPEASQSPAPSVVIGDNFLSEKASMELVASAYTLEWQLEVIDNVEHMRFTLICATNGWVGLGFAKDENSAMVDADIIIGKVETGVYSVDDYWASSFSQPTTDTSLGSSKDVELISGTELDGVTTIVFRRKLTAIDSHDRSISKTSSTPLIFAWHSSSDELLYHTVTNRGKRVIDLYRMLPLSISEPSPTSFGEFQGTGFGGSVPVDSLSDLSFNWNIVNKSDHKWLNATIRMKTSGLSYMAIGVQENMGDLTGSDIIKVESSGQYCDLHDSWAVDEETVKYDYMLGGNNDLDHVYCNTKDGYIEAGFMRLINTGDGADLAILENGNSNVIFLWDRSEIDFNPQTLQTKSFKVDFFTMEGSRAWEVVKGLPTSPPVMDSPSPETPEESTAPSGQITLNEENEYTMSYTVLGSDIAIELSLKGTGFAGVGIPGADRNMHSADVIVAVNDGQGGCQIDDYWSETFATPTKDVDLGGVDNLKNKKCTIEDGYIKAEFVRPSIGEDDFDRSLFANTSSATIIYAFHTSSDGLQYHGSTSRGVVDLNLTPEGTDSQELLQEEFDDNARKDLAEGYTVWWKIVEDQSSSTAAIRKKSRKLMQENDLHDDAEVIIKLQWKSIGWMGFGIEPADASVNGMQDTDMYIGWIAMDSTVTIMDAWSVGFMKPESDSDQGGENSILAYAGEEKDGVSTIVFKRRVNTGDPYDRAIKLGEQDVVFAFGDSDGLPAGGHGPCCRGKTTLNWAANVQSVPGPKTPAVPNENLKNAHAWMMVLAWAVFAILGSMVSHMGRHWKYWIKAHVALEIIAVVLSSLGEIIALSYTEGKIRGAHGALFFILLFTMIPQMFIGYFTVKSDKPHLKKIHRGLGYLVIGTACWQVWLGMKLFKMDTRFIQCFYAWLISVGVAFNFSAEGPTVHDFKAQLEKKGIEVEEAGTKKTRRSSTKSRVFEGEKAKEVKKSDLKKNQNESKDEASFSIKSGRTLSQSGRMDHAHKDSSDKNKSSSQGIEANIFMENCESGKQWTVINQKVYDMTQMVSKHPGGPDQILDIIGKDGSELYNTHHGSSESAHRMLAKTLLGDLVEENSN